MSLVNKMKEPKTMRELDGSDLCLGPCKKGNICWCAEGMEITHGIEPKLKEEYPEATDAELRRAVIEFVVKSLVSYAFYDLITSPLPSELKKWNALLSKVVDRQQSVEQVILSQLNSAHNTAQRCVEEIAVQVA